MHEVTKSIEAKITFFPSLLKAKSAIINDLVELLNEAQSKLVKDQTDSYPTLLKQSIQMLKPILPTTASDTLAWWLLKSDSELSKHFVQSIKQTMEAKVFSHQPDVVHTDQEILREYTKSLFKKHFKPPYSATELAFLRKTSLDDFIGNLFSSDTESLTQILEQFVDLRSSLDEKALKELTSFILFELHINLIETLTNLPLATILNQPINLISGSCHITYSNDFPELKGKYSTQQKLHIIQLLGQLQMIGPLKFAQADFLPKLRETITLSAAIHAENTRSEHAVEAGAKSTQGADDAHSEHGGDTGSDAKSIHSEGERPVKEVISSALFSQPTIDQLQAAAPAVEKFVSVISSYINGRLEYIKEDAINNISHNIKGFESLISANPELQPIYKQMLEDYAEKYEETYNHSTYIMQTMLRPVEQKIDEYLAENADSPMKALGTIWRLATIFKEKYFREKVGSPEINPEFKRFTETMFKVFTKLGEMYQSKSSKTLKLYLGDPELADQDILPKLVDKIDEEVFLGSKKLTHLSPNYEELVQTLGLFYNVGIPIKYHSLPISVLFNTKVWIKLRDPLIDTLGAAFPALASVAINALKAGADGLVRKEDSLDINYSTKLVTLGLSLANLSSILGQVAHIPASNTLDIASRFYYTFVYELSISEVLRQDLYVEVHKERTLDLALSRLEIYENFLLSLDGPEKEHFYVNSVGNYEDVMQHVKVIRSILMLGVKSLSAAQSKTAMAEVAELDETASFGIIKEVIIFRVFASIRSRVAKLRYDIGGDVETIIEDRIVIIKGTKYRLDKVFTGLKQATKGIKLYADRCVNMVRQHLSGLARFSPSLHSVLIANKTKAMQEAVAAQNFECAIVLRDEINRLKSTESKTDMLSEEKVDAIAKLSEQFELGITEYKEHVCQNTQENIDITRLFINKPTNQDADLISPSKELSKEEIESMQHPSNLQELAAFMKTL
ncbi:MAG: UvrB/UvrC motif-containing protein [Pseudomonadota bacterium]|nr:UvrB/UvrC motif-containing protein [Pseudomonadota bacterium]